MSSDLILSVKNLSKIYQSKKPFKAVDSISFFLKKGEILGLLGANGAGKTTTIQMLLSTLKPTSGEIFYFGKNFFTHRSEILNSVAFASTYISLPWNLTIEQNLKVFGKIYGLTAGDLNRQISTLLERFGIEEKRHSLVSTLSAGQTTRLMLIKAFMVRPKIVLLDEPTASLDPDMAKDVIQFVLEQREQEGVSILFTSHNMTEVAEVCDRILFLQKGKIVADDVPDKLARSASAAKLELVMGDGLKRTIAMAEEMKLPFFVEHRTITLEVNEEQIAQFLGVLASRGVSYTGINIIQPTLADYFLKMVEEENTRKEARMSSTPSSKRGA
jgi:ABC-2 type transport system ATP-binding protein